MRRSRNGSVTRERVMELLSYNPETGALTWLKFRGGSAPQIGEEAGSGTLDGHRNIGIDGIRFLAHRIIWLYVYGNWPSVAIDHINGDPLDNRLCNLREASTQQNCMNQKRHKNSTTKYVGVTFHKISQRWRARMGQTHIGWFASEEAAHEAYLAKLRKLAETFPVPVHPSSVYL